MSLGVEGDLRTHSKGSDTRSGDELTVKQVYLFEVVAETEEVEGGVRHLGTVV